MRKILDFISVISFLLTITMTGAIAYSYIYIKNPENQEKTKKFVKKEKYIFLNLGLYTSIQVVGIIIIFFNPL